MRPKPARITPNTVSALRPQSGFFGDAFAIERLDDRKDYGEDRYSILGMVDGRLLYVAHTMREGIVRIISARGAEPYERRQYHEDNT
jgi:uncharacterized DUF497 family protein